MAIHEPRHHGALDADRSGQISARGESGPGTRVSDVAVLPGERRVADHRMLSELFASKRWK
jgi:hypothetical protein